MDKIDLAVVSKQGLLIICLNVPEQYYENIGSGVQGSSQWIFDHWFWFRVVGTPVISQIIENGKEFTSTDGHFKDNAIKGLTGFITDFDKLISIDNGLLRPIIQVNNEDEMLGAFMHFNQKFDKPIDYLFEKVENTNESKSNKN